MCRLPVATRKHRIFCYLKRYINRIRCFEQRLVRKLVWSLPKTSLVPRLFSVRSYLKTSKAFISFSEFLCWKKTTKWAKPKYTTTRSQKFKYKHWIGQFSSQVKFVYYKEIQLESINLSSDWKKSGLIRNSFFSELCLWAFFCL